MIGCNWHWWPTFSLWQQGTTWYTTVPPGNGQPVTSLKWSPTSQRRSNTSSLGMVNLIIRFLTWLIILCRNIKPDRFQNREHDFSGCKHDFLLCLQIFMQHIFFYYSIFINTLGFKRCLFSRMKKSKDFLFGMPPLACRIWIHC